MPCFARSVALTLMLSGLIWVNTAGAEPLKIGMLLSNPQQIRIEFPLVGAEKHFAVYVKREGMVAEGSTWAGAKVQEVGLHDVFPGDRVWGTGYITFTLPNGNLGGIRGVGRFQFKPPTDDPNDRVWDLTGDIAVVKK